MNIYVDGSYKPKTSTGAYGILIVTAQGEEQITGIEENVTNNVMELKALINCLLHIKKHKLDEEYFIVVHSDSQYVVNGLQLWWDKWVANGYKTSTGKPVKNLELWKELIALAETVKCELQWVKGHADNKLHNKIDKAIFELVK